MNSLTRRPQTRMCHGRASDCARRRRLRHGGSGRRPRGLGRGGGVWAEHGARLHGLGDLGVGRVRVGLQVDAAVGEAVAVGGVSLAVAPAGPPAHRCLPGRRSALPSAHASCAFCQVASSTPSGRKPPGPPAAGRPTGTPWDARTGSRGPSGREVGRPPRREAAGAAGGHGVRDVDALLAEAVEVRRGPGGAPPRRRRSRRSSPFEPQAAATSRAADPAASARVHRVRRDTGPPFLGVPRAWGIPRHAGHATAATSTPTSDQARRTLRIGF